MIDTWHISFLLLTALAGLGYFFTKRSPWVRKYIPVFVWAAKIFRAVASAWKFKKAYRDTAEVLFKYSVLLETAEFKQSADVSKEWFSKFVVDTYKTASGTIKDKEDATRLVNAVYALLEKHHDLLETLKSFENVKDIDVKKTTLIVADFLGELVNIEHKLDRQFYEHMVYGVNKALLELKSGSANKETVSKVSSTVWRMFQIARAYSRQKSMSTLTSKELMDQLEKTMLDLVKVYFKSK